MAEMVPVGRAARVLHYHADGDGAMCLACLGNAKAALTAAVEDREGLARTLRAADCTGRDHGTSACPDRHCRDDAVLERRYMPMADAVARWLTGADDV